MQDQKTFEAALRRITPFLTELTDDFIVVLMDDTGDAPQPVLFMHGEIDNCRLLADAASEHIKDHIDEIQDSESGGDPD